MRNPIAHALGWALIPALLWLLTLTLPPTGTRRQRPGTARPTRSPRHRAPGRRSPYAREQSTLLDGGQSRLARPYLAGPPNARAVQRRRRQALWLATVGLDVDQRDIHAGGAR
ncbi:hypothetical protein ACFVZW_33340 [Streptomyces sp. NPDC059567]|uniref:hypothetical protein n=1 Tax=Streptomyces sp. NPDC059567 TaxID=3346867 RepID=UPI0036B299C5